MAERAATPTPPPEAPQGARILIIVAPFYREIAALLVAGARARLEEAGVEAMLAEVPGALEIPAAAAMAHQSGAFDGVVALGCVIRGETSHYDTVCNESARGLMELGLQGFPVGNGILTVETEAQALRRADPADMNKGAGAADAALALVALREMMGLPRWREDMDDDA